MTSVEGRMQQAAEQRLANVDEAWYALEENPDDPVASAVAGLFCGGCYTCTVREVLETAVPILLEAIRTGEFLP